MTDALFSRTGKSNPLGKCTEDVKTLVPEEAKNSLNALAFLNSQTLSEYVRDVLIAHVYGQSFFIQSKLPNRRGAQEGQE